jgi:hypothetical protein
VRVESSAAPTSGNRHFLSTNLEPSTNQPTSYHGCPVVDAATPLQADGATPVFKPVWDYLLLHETADIAIEATTTNLTVTFSPGTLEQSTNLTSWTTVTNANSPLSLPKRGFGERGFFRRNLGQ